VVTIRTAQWSLYVPSSLTSSSYILPTERIYVFCTALRTDSKYISVYSIDRMIFIKEMECSLRGTDWISKYVRLIFACKD